MQLFLEPASLIMFTRHLRAVHHRREEERDAAADGHTALEMVKGLVVFAELLVGQPDVIVRRRKGRLGFDHRVIERERFFVATAVVRRNAAGHADDRRQ